MILPPYRGKMTWSLAFTVRDNKVEVTSQTNELPDMNVTLNGHEDGNSNNVNSYVSVLKEK